MGSQKLNMAPSGAFARVAGLCVVAIGLQACSSSNTLTSGYGSSYPSLESLQSRGSPDSSYAAGGIELSRHLHGARRAPNSFNYAAIYGGMVDEGISIPAFDYTKMNPK